MIDYFALALGHGLLVLVFVRLFMRESLDVDPAIEELKQKAASPRPDPRGKRLKGKHISEEPSEVDDAVNEPRASTRADPRRGQSLSAQKAARRSSRSAKESRAR